MRIPDVPAGTTPLELEKYFKASPRRVFDAYTRPESLERWWCPPGWRATRFELDLRVGGAYTLEMTRQKDGAVVGAYGTYLAVEPARLLAYTLRWQGQFPGLPETRVDLEFVPHGEGTLLRLRHDGFGDEGQREGHRAPWIAACDRVEEILSS